MVFMRMPDSGRCCCLSRLLEVLGAILRSAYSLNQVNQFSAEEGGGMTYDVPQSWVGVLTLDIEDPSVHRRGLKLGSMSC